MSYCLLLLTCFFYGASTLIKNWSDFATKLINVLAIIAIIVLTLATMDPEDGITAHIGLTDYWWLQFVFPIIAVWIGNEIFAGIKDDDWPLIFLVIAGLGLIATIITACCGL